MTATLLIIDPQNDFLDIEGAALPVAGANADMARLAELIHGQGDRLANIVVTLDSHAAVGIERTSFWMTQSGGPVAPFTQVTAADVASGRFKPRNPALLDRVKHYLRDLEAQGRYKLMVWPIHCVVGTRGHNIHADLNKELMAWEERLQRGVLKILKGRNPLTEQYSAVRAEVIDATDPATGDNLELISASRPVGGPLLVAGEASSHCVAATMEHLVQHFNAEEIERVVILRDCMSPVAGFETNARGFFDSMQALGARVMTAKEVAAFL